LPIYLLLKISSFGYGDDERFIFAFRHSVVSIYFPADKLDFKSFCLTIVADLSQQVGRNLNPFHAAPSYKGVNAFSLRDLLGHTSTRTTERYARPSTETLAAVEKALAS